MKTVKCWCGAALHLARELGHPYSLGYVLSWAIWLHVERGDGRVAQERADAMVALSSEQGFPYWWAWGTLHRGGALIAQAQWAEGVAQVRQGLNALERGEVAWTFPLSWLAAGYGGAGRVEDGLATIAEALRLVDKNDERIYEGRCIGSRGNSHSKSSKFQVQSSKVLIPDP